MGNLENCIEFTSGDKYCVVTYTNRKHINRVMKIYEEHKEEFKYLVENPDGSICAKFPLKWIKMNPGSKTGRSMTDEQREASKARLAKYWEEKKKNKEECK